MIPTQTEPATPAYAVYQDGHSEYLGDYRWAPGLPAQVRAYAIWDDQPLALKKGMVYIVVLHDCTWCVCDKHGAAMPFEHTSLDAALMWGSLNL